MRCKIIHFRNLALGLKIFIVGIQQSNIGMIPVAKSDKVPKFEKVQKYKKIPSCEKERLDYVELINFNQCRNK